MIKSLGLHEIFKYIYASYLKPAKYEFNVDDLNKEDTYLVIFGPNRTTYDPSILERSDKVNVLFKSETAVNRKQGHGTDPRNTVVVFELK